MIAIFQHALTRILRSGLILVLAIAFVTPASACSVCFSAKEETLAAFHFTTAFLTVLPFLMIGSAVLLLRRRMKMLANRPPS